MIDVFRYCCFILKYIICFNLGWEMHSACVWKIFSVPVTPLPPIKQMLNSTYSFVFYSSHLGRNSFLTIFCTYAVYDWYGLCLQKLDETLQVSCVQKVNNAKKVMDNFCSSVRWYTQSAVSYWDTKCSVYKMLSVII